MVSKKIYIYTFRIKITMSMFHSALKQKKKEVIDRSLPALASYVDNYLKSVID